MAKKFVGFRLDSAVLERLDAIALANKVTRTDVIEELLLHSLEHQDEELASTFLLPRVEAVLTQLFDRHLWSLRSVLVQAAVESTVSSRLGLLKFAADNGYAKDQLSELRNQAYQAAVRRLKRKGVMDEEVTEFE